MALKIFYAVQATGNGHISRAIELLPFIEKYGTVDVFLSGGNSSLPVDLPVKYKSAGLSLFYTKRGNLDYKKMWQQLSLRRIHKEAKDLPVEKYDIVINDFESITSIACKLKNVHSLGFGHQASFQSAKTPRPKRKNIAGELILGKYATAASYIGLHFEQYDDFIYSPVLKKDILDASLADKNFVAVYLPHYSDEIIEAYANKVDGISFRVFSKSVKEKVVKKNVEFIPVSNDAFNKSLINCTGIITGAGFETPAEALYLGKKLMCIPIKGQYEQLCNAAALENFNVCIIPKIEKEFDKKISEWLQAQPPKQLNLSTSTEEVVEIAIKKALQKK